FPLALERNIAVMVYMPFGRTRLWERVEGHDVPEWAGEFGAQTWAQFFLKFAASHPAGTVVTPATSRPHHMEDNMQAAYGRLPDEAERRRMIDFIESLPSGPENRGRHHFRRKWCLTQARPRPRPELTQAENAS